MVDAFFDRGLAAHGEFAVHAAEGARVRCAVEQLVSAALRSRDGGVVEDHPRCVGEERRDLDRMSDRIGGCDGEILGVFVEIEGAGRGAVIEAQVFAAPVLAGDPAAPAASVTDDGALDGADAGPVQDLFPLGEQLFHRDGAVIFGGRGRVSAADDIEVALEDAVHDAAAVGEVRPETVVGPEAVQGGACGDDFDVGSGHHAFVRIEGGQRVSAEPHGQHAPGRSLQRRVALHLTDGGAEVGLRGSRNGQRQTGQEDRQFLHRRNHQKKRGCLRAPSGNASWEGFMLRSSFSLRRR